MVFEIETLSEYYIEYNHIIMLINDNKKIFFTLLLYILIFGIIDFINIVFNSMCKNYTHLLYLYICFLIINYYEIIYENLLKIKKLFLKIINLEFLF